MLELTLNGKMRVNHELILIFVEIEIKASPTTLLFYLT